MPKRLFTAAILGLILTLPFSEVALAASNGLIQNQGKDWTIYAFGNAAAVQGILESTAVFVQSNTFKNIVAMIAVIGVLAVGVSSGFSSAIGRKFIGYIVSTYLVCYVLFGSGGQAPLVVNVGVVDTISTQAVGTIEVPAVVGIPAALISTFGYKLTEQIESAFSTATYGGAELSKGAPFNLAASMINDAARAKITDPNLAPSLAYYVQDCFMIEAARGQKDAATLLNSKNFLEDISSTHPSIYVYTTLGETPDSEGVQETVPCKTAYERIKARINKSSEAADFLTDASAWVNTPALDVVNSAADIVASRSSQGVSTSGGAMVKQAAVIGAFTGAFRQAAIQTGNSEFITALSLSQAQASQKNSWILGAEIFNKTMGYIYAIIQVLVYGLTPIVLVALLVPGLGASLFKNFGQILLWLALWQPMLAIANYIVTVMQFEDLGQMMMAGGSFGFSMANIGIITEKSANMKAAATFIGTMIPILAWALVKGSVDFSRVIGSAVGENFAQGASNTATTGNFSLNQGSMDSFTANKTSIGSNFDAGLGNTANGALAEKPDLGGRNPTLIRGTPQSLAVSTSAGVSSQASMGTVMSKVGTSGSQDQAMKGESHTTSSGVAATGVRTNSERTSGSVSGQASISGFAKAGGGQPTPGAESGTPGSVANNAGQRGGNALNTDQGKGVKRYMPTLGANVTGTREAGHSTQVGTSANIGEQAALMSSHTKALTEGTQISEADSAGHNTVATNAATLSLQAGSPLGAMVNMERYRSKGHLEAMDRSLGNSPSNLDQNNPIAKLLDTANNPNRLLAQHADAQARVGAHQGRLHAEKGSMQDAFRAQVNGVKQQVADLRSRAGSSLSAYDAEVRTGVLASVVARIDQLLESATASGAGKEDLETLLDMKNELLDIQNPPVSPAAGSLTGGAIPPVTGNSGAPRDASQPSNSPPVVAAATVTGNRETSGANALQHRGEDPLAPGNKGGPEAEATSIAAERRLV